MSKVKMTIEFIINNTTVEEIDKMLEGHHPSILLGALVEMVDENLCIPMVTLSEIEE